MNDLYGADVYAVGMPANALVQKTLDRFKQDGATIYSDNSQFIFHIAVENPTQSEINSLNKDVVFGYIRRNESLFFAIKTDNLKFDAPLSPLIVPLSQRGLPGIVPHGPLEDGSRMPLIVLIHDRITGILRSMRIFDLPASFTSNLNEDMNAILKLPERSTEIVNSIHNDTINEMYRIYKTPVEMLKGCRSRAKFSKLMG